MQLTKDEAEFILANARRSVNNRRAYAHHGAVWYPIATLVWVAHTGEWPKSTPRHLNNDPLDNSFENLRAPGRTKKPRKPKTLIRVMEQNQQVAAPVVGHGYTPAKSVSPSLFA